jgi:predicted Kef-type K+ transport protein
MVFPGNDVFWDLPSLVFGICYSDSQTVLSFKAAFRRQSMSKHRAGNMQVGRHAMSSTCITVW